METKGFIQDNVQLLEIALSVKHDPSRADVYSGALEDLSELQLNHAFKRAVKSWQPAYGRTFPSPGEIRVYAEEIDGPPAPVHNSVTEIDPEKLPKGWTQQEWLSVQLTLRKVREEASRPMPFDPDAPPNESPKDYAKRLIGQMRASIKAGANSFPGKGVRK